jgi:syntaxin-binding protein 1
MNLVDVTKKKLLEGCIDEVKPASGWKVLVVDAAAMKVISACCKMYDIVEHGVSVVEGLEKSREPLPKLEAIYLMSPDADSVARLVADFADEREPQYAAAHLYFTGRVSDAQLAAVAACAPLKRRTKTFKELYVDYLAYESRVFHLDRPGALVALFSPDSKTLKNEQAAIVGKLASLCAAVDEYPDVRYSKRHPLAGALAGLLADRLASMGRIAGGPLAGARAERATLLLLDRTEDVAGPLLHEFTYQAMVYDLLGVDAHGPRHDLYEYEFKSTKGGLAKKDVLLAETDAVWRQLRHSHIAEAINWVIEELNAFLKNNKAANFKKSEVTSVEDMTEALRAMPEYKEMLAKYELHVSVADACMKQFNKSAMTDVAAVEQGLATGEDADGKPYKNAITQLSPLLADDNVSADNKLRLLALFLITQEGVEEKTRKKLVETAQLDAAGEDALANLTYLGVSLKKASLKAKLLAAATGKKKKGKAAIEDEVPYELSRFQPVLRDVIENLVNDELSETQYPRSAAAADDDDDDDLAAAKKKKAAKAGTSLKSGSGAPKSKWASKKAGAKESADQFAGPRIIIFVAGGVTLAEIRIVYELSIKLKRDIIIGSTHILTPREFLTSLKQLHSSATAAKADDPDDDDDDDDDDDTPPPAATKKAAAAASSSTTSKSKK